MQFKDYYDTLGVKRGASADEVKRAYRKLARKYHPDVSKERNAESKFKDVQEAYEVLKDPEKRATYDRLGRDYRPGQQFRPPPDWDQHFGQSGSQRFTDLNGFSDFFSSLFGGAGGPGAGGANGFGPGGSASSGAGFGRRQAEADAGVVEVTVEEAFSGTKRRVAINEGGRSRQVDVQIPAGIGDGQALRIGGGPGHPLLGAGRKMPGAPAADLAGHGEQDDDHHQQEGGAAEGAGGVVRDAGLHQLQHQQGQRDHRSAEGVGVDVAGETGGEQNRGGLADGPGDTQDDRGGQTRAGRRQDHRIDHPAARAGPG